MKQVKRFLTVMFMLLWCVAIQAADDLITQQITIKLDSAGTLSDKIGSTEMYKIANLKIIGEINGTDLRMIRDMAGSDSLANSTDGKLATLDLSEVKIVSGGGFYYIDNDGHHYYTKDNVLGDYAFYWCSSLTSIEIPSGVTSIGNGAFSGCSSLESIYVSWETPISIAADVFDEVNKQKCTLYVPQGTYLNYMNAVGWRDFANIVEYNATGVDNVTTSTDVKEVARYSLNGQRLTAPTGGLNIVKYSDGSVKKVVVQ